MKSLLGFLIGLILLPLVASAEATTTVADLQALMDQLHALQAQVQAQGGGSTNTCAVPQHPIARGSRGTDVTLLQKFLAHNSQTWFPDPQITGLFGPLTVAAVQRFQIEKGIASSGTPATTGFGAVGPKTLAAIQAAAACSTGVMTVQAVTATVQTQQTNPLVQQNVVLPPVPSISFVSPAAGAHVAQGGGMSIQWKSNTEVPGATVSLALKLDGGKNISTLVQGKSPSGSFFWTVPAPVDASGSGSSNCTSDPITCLLALAAPVTKGTGGSSGLAPGTYRISGTLSQGSIMYSTVDSDVFTVDGVKVVPQSTSTVNAVANDNSFSNFGGGTSPSIEALLQTLGGSNANSGATDSPGCTYSGVTYPEGIVLNVSCGDLAGQSCSTYGAAQLTCTNGKWIGPDGTSPSIKNVTAAPATGASCKTPWGSQTVTSGQQIPYQPFFTSGTYPRVSQVPLMQCNKGTWMICDWQGANCASYYAQ